MGITLQLYDHGAAVGRKGACCAGQDIHDARRVADRLGIPHYVLDYESRFRAAVMDDFADSYLQGETPIPCVRCNQRVKFRDLLETARELGAEALATGHYVRRVEGAGGPELHRAADPARDQSYFLFATTRAQLDFLRFPLGGCRRRRRARWRSGWTLPVAAKPDSQDICFVPNGSYARVVERLRPGALEPGEIVHVDGRVLGRHEGIINFTVGPAARASASPTRRAAASRSTSCGSTRRASAWSWGRSRRWRSPRMSLREVNWLGGAAGGGRRARRQREGALDHAGRCAATVFAAGEGARVAFAEPQDGVAPGQACVFYAGDRVLGGGWIARAEAAAAAA